MVHKAESRHESGFPPHRLEAFSDAVFAFAVTLLVVSLEVPHSASELFHVMRGFIAFGVCFLFLVVVWVDHAWYFKRYATHDGWMVTLNMILLFIVLLYVYPMKFLFTALLNEAVWREHDTSVQSVAELRTLLRIYGAGFLALSLTFWAMYHHAWRKRIVLKLDASESEALRGALRRHIINLSVAGLSLLSTLIASDAMGLIWSMCYMAIGPLQAINGVLTGQRTAALRQRLGHGA